MKLTRGLTVLVLASGLTSGLAFGATEDDSGIFGIQDAQTGQLERIESGVPTETAEVSDSEATLASERGVTQESHGQEQDEQQLASASQFEPMG